MDCKINPSHQIIITSPNNKKETYCEEMTDEVMNDSTTYCLPFYSVVSV